MVTVTVACKQMMVDLKQIRVAYLRFDIKYVLQCNWGADICIKYRNYPFELYHKLQDCLSEDYKSVNLKTYILMCQIYLTQICMYLCILMRIYI